MLSFYKQYLRYLLWLNTLASAELLICLPGPAQTLPICHPSFVYIFHLSVACTSQNNRKHIAHLNLETSLLAHKFWTNKTIFDQFQISIFGYLNIPWDSSRGTVTLILCSYLLTPYSTVLENLTSPQLTKKFPTSRLPVPVLSLIDPVHATYPVSQS